MTRSKAIEVLRNLLKELTEDFDALTEEEHEAYPSEDGKWEVEDA